MATRLPGNCDEADTPLIYAESTPSVLTTDIYPRKVHVPFDVPGGTVLARPSESERARLSAPAMARRSAKHVDPPLRAALRLLVMSARALLLIAGGTAAVAQERGRDQSYPPEFFRAASPQTALDMVERLPGFEIDAGAVARGLEGTVPNVLIDGKPIISRSEGVSEVLRRIPAGQVFRIDVLRGEGSGIDLRGHPVVANVLRKRIADNWAAVTVATTVRNRRADPQMQAEVGFDDGGTSADGTILHFRNRGVDRNATITFLDSALAANAAHHLETAFRGTGTSGSGRLQYGLSGGVMVHGNVSHSRNANDSRVVARTSEAAPAYTTHSISRDHYSDMGIRMEASGDRGTVAANLLHSFGNSSYSEAYQEVGFFGKTTGGSRYSETIVSISASQPSTLPVALSAGAEVALNRLDQSFRLSFADVPFAVPFDDVRTSEDRLNAFARAVTKSGKVTAEGEIAVDASTIRSEADEGRFSEDFLFLKPKLTVTYLPDGRTTLRAIVRRRIGQLDFGDFAAVASLELGTVNAGNVAIRPEEAWEAELGAERRFWDRGSLSLELVAGALDNVIDYRPGTGGFDVVGNIGSGHALRATMAAELPLDRLGIKNTLVEADATWRRSRVTDPVTRRERGRSDETGFEGLLRLTHDVPASRLTVRAEYRFGEDTRRYRVAEERRIERAARVRVEAEHKPVTGISVKGWADLVPGDDLTRRTLYDGIRGGTVRQIEIRSASPYASAGVSLRVAI